MLTPLLLRERIAFRQALKTNGSRVEDLDSVLLVERIVELRQRGARVRIRAPVSHPLDGEVHDPRRVDALLFAVVRQRSRERGEFVSDVLQDGTLAHESG